MTEIVCYLLLAVSRQCGTFDVQALQFYQIYSNTISHLYGFHFFFCFGTKCEAFFPKMIWIAKQTIIKDFNCLVMSAWSHVDTLRVVELNRHQLCFTLYKQQVGEFYNIFIIMYQKTFTIFSKVFPTSTKICHSCISFPTVLQ